MLIDSHTHLEGFARQGQLPAVLERARAVGVERVIAIGTCPDDWDLHRQIAMGDAGRIFFTVGVHPCAVGEDWEGAVASMGAFWEPGGSPVVPVALGECGLDRFHLPKDDPAEAERVFARQDAAFRGQLALAKRLDCPLVVHSRGAFQECVDRIDASGVDWRRVVFHCFTEGPAEMDALVERGGRGSFTGILTYRSAEAVRAAALAQGVGRLMVETDAPYLAPVPHRGKTNEPAFLRHTFEAAASLFGADPAALEQRVQATTEAFFGLV